MLYFSKSQQAGKGYTAFTVHWANTLTKMIYTF